MLSLSKKFALWPLLATFMMLTQALSPGTSSISGNLAIGRTLTASSTCGSTEPERFCAQPSTKTDCAVCDLSQSDFAHPASHMTDEDSVSADDEERTWWQSESGTNNVTIQLDLENTFLFTHILMLFKSVVPAAMIIQKSTDFGSTYRPLQYFSTDCEKHFSMPDSPGGISSGDVICTSAYQEGEVIYLAFPPPAQADLSNPDIVTRAKVTNLRFQLLAFSGDGFPKPQLWHYAIYHLEVWGRCFCSGKSEQCLQTEAEMANGAVPSTCQCSEGTDGINCEKCLPLYNNQDPQSGSCAKCECNGHANSCHYDHNKSQGVCDNCADDTAGSQCEQCRQGFYRDQNACLACACDPAGTVSGTFCAEEDGQCTCKNNTTGLHCDQCQEGFFGLSEANPDGCQACSCNGCNNLTGRCPPDGTPSLCPFHQFYDGTSCQDCGCSELGSFGVCDTMGSCICKPGVRGKQCDQCLPGYYNLSASGCMPCDCDLAGSHDSTECNPLSGQCSCRDRVSGRRCDTCPAGTIGPSAETVQACIDCFCNGFSKDCFSASEWYLTETPMFQYYSDGSREVHVYFPTEYLGDKRTAYGLTFSLTVGFPELESFNSGIKMGLIIYGRLGYSRVKVKKTFDVVDRETKTYQVPMIESEFEQVLYYRQPATMEYFREGLANISRMKLVIEFPTDIPEDELTVNISSAKMLYADHGYDPTTALSPQEVSFVEECACKRDRQGPVCGQCSEGYHFDYPGGINGEFSYCVPCYCLGYSEKCDPVSGACLDCQENHAGDDCETCIEGFVLDPATFECLSTCICSMNADDCMRATGDCICKPGYFGNNCQFCAEGYYGNALQQNCTGCGCNDAGTVEETQCCPETGQCICKPFVTGRSCDRCENNYWGLASGVGCTECGCSVQGAIDNTCDLISGQCTCEVGYSGRTCDICADGYTDAGAGNCVACNCNPESSLSAVCDKQNGSCQCHEGVSGEKCDQCLDGTTHLLPYCEFCDECSSAWDKPIQQLVDNGTRHIMIASLINVTNTTDSDTLQSLYKVLMEIEMHLNASAIDTLVNSTLELFHELCEKLTLLEDLLRSAMFVKVELNGTLTDAIALNTELSQNITKLRCLVSLSVNISFEAAQLKTVDFASIVNKIREAEERSNTSLELVMTEVNPSITQANQALQNFLSKGSEFSLIASNVSLLLSELQVAITRYQSLVDEASRSLCGNPHEEVCVVCDGVGCDFCGGEGCDGSVGQLHRAHSISDQAMGTVQHLLESLVNTTNDLRQARDKSELALNNSIEAVTKANMAQLLALSLSTDTESLLVIVVDALNNDLSLSNLDMLEMLESETLLLHISKTPEEVYTVLTQINSTIDQIKNLSTDVGDLRTRAEVALSTSMSASATATEVLSGISLLQTQLNTIGDLRDETNASVAVAAERTKQANEKTEEARMELDNLSASLPMLEMTVDELNVTVKDLEERFQNISNMLTDIIQVVGEAQKISGNVQSSTTELEGQEIQLNNDADAKLMSATVGLEDAETLRIMAESARERAVEQLILAERLLNKRERLVKQQMHIRDDIKRVATELEGLDRLINSRIAINTVCLYNYIP